MRLTQRPVNRLCRPLALAALLLFGAAGPASAEPFTLNLQNAELRSLIETVSKRTERNFIVDPRVNAKVTVVSSTPVNDRELYDIFLAVLSVHGYAAVPDGDTTKIVPATSAKQDSIPTGDQAGAGSQLVTRVVTIEHVNSAQLVPILRPLLPQEGHLAAYQPTNRLIVTDSQSNIQRIMRIIDRVDQPVESGTNVIKLKHASASEVVRVIGQVQGQGGQGGQGGSGQARLAADSRTNSILISGPRQARLRMRSLIANLDTPLEREGNTRVLYLKYANAEDMTTILEGVNQAQAQGAGQGGQGDSGQSANTDEVVIQADPNTNALIITGPPDRLDGLASIVRQLDIRRAQVLVEAIIAEISQDKARELGVQFIAGDTSGDGDQPAAMTSFSSGGSNIIELATENALPGSGLSLGGITNDGGTDFGVLVRALASDANNNILSTPSLVTLDNEEAEIVVGQEVPFITGSFSSDDTGGGANNPFQTIERRDVGITLKVKPQINEGDTVKMDIEQEVSSLTSSAQATADVVTNNRSLKTTVLVQDDQTLVLGGLIDDSVRTTDEKVPLLGDIPGVGRLFRFQSTQKMKQNLMVFLHPRILRDKSSADHYTQQKYGYIRQEQAKRLERDQTLMIDELPALPELELQHDKGSATGQGDDDERNGNADSD